MIKNSQRQTGSAHVFIMSILVLAVVGILGFVLWQNFIKSDDTQEVINNTSETSQDQPIDKDSLAYSNETIGVKFDYPKDWVKLECDNMYVENPRNTVYFGTNNYGIGIVDGNNSNLCGGGTDFPPQVVIARRDAGGEFAGTYTNVTIDGKTAKKYITTTGQDSILPGLEMTRYVVDMGNGRYVSFGYNRFPAVTGDERDNSESSLQRFIQMVEESVRFL